MPGLWAANGCLADADASLPNRQAGRVDGRGRPGPVVGGVRKALARQHLRPFELSFRSGELILKDVNSRGIGLRIHFDQQRAFVDGGAFVEVRREYTPWRLGGDRHFVDRLNDRGDFDAFDEILGADDEGFYRDGWNLLRRCRFCRRATARGRTERHAAHQDCCKSAESKLLHVTTQFGMRRSERSARRAPASALLVRSSRNACWSSSSTNSSSLISSIECELASPSS